MSNVNVNIVGTGNFTQVEAAIKHLQSSIAQLNATGAGGAAFNKSIAQSIAQVNALAQAQGLMKVHTTSLATEADRLTSRIAKGKTTFTDFRNAVGGATKANSTFMEIARKQIAIQNMSAIQVGKAIYGYENLGRAQLAGAAAARAQATAIAASNAVLRQSMVHVVNWGKNMQWTGRQLTMGLTMPLVLFGAQAAKIFNEVDKNLTRLSKVYGVGLAKPTTAALESIRKEMIALSTELGKSLGISAAEVTDIGAQFAAAGLQGQQLIYATKQAARMVVLGEADKQEAINATISLQTAYKLNTNELTEAVNFFNAAQAATSTNMADLINAVPRVGPVVKQLGGTYKDMVAIITALKEGGVPAGEAANAIKNSLGRIINPTKAARESLKGFGIDIEGIVNKNAGNLTGTLLELQSGLKKLDGLSRQRAISELFGKYQFARMSAFIENFGTVGTQSQKVMEMMGMSAQELAAIADEQTKKIQQSASGRFKIAVQTLKNTMLPVGEATLNMFTNILEKVTAFFDTVNNLPGPIKSALKWLLLIGGVVGPLTMMAGLFGNLLGTVGMGVVRLKVFGGALKMLFTSRDATAAKIILAGFRELDPAVTAASKAINIFKDEELTAEQVSERFAAMLETMTSGLINVQSAAKNAGAALSGAMVQGANAGATAASSMNLPLMAGITPKSKKGIQGMSNQHWFSAAQAESIGIKNARRYYSLSRFMPSQLDAFQMGVGTEPLVYNSKIVAQKEAIENRIRTWAMGVEGQLKRTAMMMSEEQWAALTEEAVARLPISAEALSKEYGTLFSQIEYISTKATADTRTVFNREMAKLRSQFSKQEITTQQYLEGQLSVVQQALQVNGETSSEYIKMNEVMIKKMMTMYSSAEAKLAGSGAAALAKFMKDTEERVTTQATSAGLRNFGLSARDKLSGTIMGGMTLANAYSFGTYSSQRIVPGTGLGAINPAARIAEIQEVAIAKVKEIDTLLQKIQTDISSMPAVKKPGLFASRERRTAYKEYMESSPQVNRQLDLAKSEYAAAISKHTSIENEIASKELQRNNMQAELDGMNARWTKKRAEKQQQIDAIDTELLAASERLTLSTQELSNVHTRLAGVETQASNLRQVGGVAGGAGISKGRFMGAAMGIGMATMLPSMMGIHNAFTDMLMQLGMVIMMMSMFGGTATIVAAALFAAYKAFDYFNKEVEKNAKATAAFIGLTKTETENLGITVRKIGDIPTKDLGDHADKARSSIEKLVESFSNLAEDDSLKQFIESLKNAAKDEKNTNWTVRQLEAKYTQYRAAGATDEAARNQVLALAQAAGIPLAGTEAIRRASSMSGYTQGEFMVSSQTRGYQALRGDIQKEFISGVNTRETEAAAKANAQNLYNIMLTTSGEKNIKILSEIEKQMKKNAGSANYYRQSVNQLFKQMGVEATSAQNKMRDFGYSTKDQLLGAQLVLNGFVNTWDDLEKIAGTKEFTILVNRMVRTQEIKAAESDFISGAEKYIKQTNDKKNDNASKSVNAQQKIVDKLKEELDIRKKIIDAQDKANNFAMSQAELQQKYNEALASGNLSEASQIQRQMVVSQAKYNEELKTTALQNKLDNAEKKLKTINDQASATKNLASTTKTAATRLEEFKTKIEEAIIKNGEPTKKTINSWVNELVSMGVPVKEAKTLIQDLVNKFSSQVDTKLTQDILKNMKFISGAMKPAIWEALFLKYVAGGMEPAEAASQAYSQAFGVKTRVTSEGTVVMDQGSRGEYSTTVWTPQTGLSGSKYKKTDAGDTGSSNSPYAGPGGGQITPWVTGGENGIMPKFGDKASAKQNYDGKTSYTSYKDNRGNTWQLVPTATGGYQWQIEGGTLTAPAYAVGGMIKSYGMGGKIMNYAMGSFGGIKGPGSWTSDSIPAMVSNGEYVVNAAAVSKVGTSFMDSLNKLGYANSAPLMSIISATGSPVIPVELVRSNNSSSLYNDHSQIIVNVASSNASPNEIANAVYGAIQRRGNMNSSRTVVS